MRPILEEVMVGLLQVEDPFKNYGSLATRICVVVNVLRTTTIFGPSTTDRVIHRGLGYYTKEGVRLDDQGVLVLVDLVSKGWVVQTEVARHLENGTLVVQSDREFSLSLDFLQKVARLDNTMKSELEDKQTGIWDESGIDLTMELDV